MFLVIVECHLLSRNAVSFPYLKMIA